MHANNVLERKNHKVIHVEGTEVYVEALNRFIKIEDTDLILEHSLVSMSIWESKWNKAYMSKFNIKTDEEILDYIRCMTVNEVDDNVYYLLNESHIEQINEYISAPMTAFRGGAPNNGKTKGGSGDTIIAELMYYWMFALNIPMECEHWHLNSLVALIEVCSIKNNPPKKMPMKDIYARNAEVNAKRRASLHSKG